MMTSPVDLRQISYTRSGSRRMEGASPWIARTPRSFASFRVAAKRLVVDALLNLEGTDRFGGVGGFVNVSRHRDNVLVNGLGAFLFGNVWAIQRFTSPKLEC